MLLRWSLQSLKTTLLMLDGSPHESYWHNTDQKQFKVWGPVQQNPAKTLSLWIQENCLFSWSDLRRLGPDIQIPVSGFKIHPTAVQTFLKLCVPPAWHMGAFPPSCISAEQTIRDICTPRLPRTAILDTRGGSAPLHTETFFQATSPS